MGGWLRTAADSARSGRGRAAEDLAVARWFETYQVTSRVPDFPGLSPSSTSTLAELLGGDDVQAAVQELLAVRLTDGSNADAARARQAFVLTLALASDGSANPETSGYAETLADYYDDSICDLVGRLGDGPMLAQIRSEALSARMIAVLHAIERHTAALSTRPAPRTEADFLTRYRAHVIDQHGKLEPPDFERRRRVPIADIYVPTVIHEDIYLERTVASVRTEPPSLTVWDLAARLDRSVLLGDPGGGKTTASTVLMHNFASDAGQRVPFLVTLRNFAAEDPPARSVVGHIEHVLETLYQCPAPPGLVDLLLLTGRAVVLFDGLDELLDTSRRADVATRVEQFCIEYPLAPVLVTSRVVGYDQARLDDRHFASYRLGGFRDEDVAEYARKWFALEDGGRPDDADTFLTESESVPDLRANPLLLSLMCILYRGEGSLPRNRAGMTATGEPLYTFTHRTFLEYFAAAQLAYESDTPEKLARALAPHAARGEWEIVAELAVQIKDSTSIEGAKRVYEVLKNLAPSRPPNVLKWELWRSPPSRSVARPEPSWPRSPRKTSAEPPPIRPSGS